MVDLERLVAIVVEEVAAAQGLARVPSQCGCHAVLYECCPDRLRGVLDAGASRLGLHATGGRPGDIAGLIDHTLLKPEATRADIERLCREAVEFRFATVCVNPTWVALASRLLRDSPVAVCSVVAPCREAGVGSKVIIEAALLTDDEKVAACTLARAAAADFVKTSTGFGPA